MRLCRMSYCTQITFIECRYSKMLRWLPQIIHQSKHNHGYNLVNFTDLVLKLGLVEVAESHRPSFNRLYDISQYRIRLCILLFPRCDQSSCNFLISQQKMICLKLQHEIWCVIWIASRNARPLIFVPVENLNLS